jgi:hypothetical protein
MSMSQETLSCLNCGESLAERAFFRSCLGTIMSLVASLEETNWRICKQYERDCRSKNLEF